MKILYLTTAIRNEDYISLLNQGYRLSNPSNQNFHEKMIQALALTNEVSVISLVPSLDHDFTLSDSGIFHYVNSSGSPLNRLFWRKKKVFKIAKCLQKNGLDIVVFDSLSLQLGEVSSRLKKVFSLPTAALVTDNPENLAKAHPIFISGVKSAVKASNGVIALSEGLIKAFDVEKKPHILFPGLVEKPQTGRPLFANGTYLYFGGALLPRYGVNDLVKAYLEIPMDYDLVLAGHAEGNEELLSLIHSNPRIHYLGQVSKEENYTLEKYAALLVNPRPFESKLDQESVPSKLLEYLESGSPILSTPHTLLRKEFPQDINWLASSGKDALALFFKNHLNGEKKWVNLLPNNAKENLYAQYGLEAIDKKIQDFLQSLKA